MELGVILVVLVCFGLWLAGHWFGRAVVFVALGCALAFISMAIFEGKPWAILPFLSAWPVAWFVARLPWMYWTRKANQGWQVVD